MRKSEYTKEHISGARVRKITGARLRHGVTFPYIQSKRISRYCQLIKLAKRKEAIKAGDKFYAYDDAFWRG